MKIPRWLWIKRYFDIGLGLTSYVKYPIALFGLYSIGEKIPIKWTILLAIIWWTSNFFVGYWWVKKRLMEMDNEISNQLNPFQKEVRKKLNKKV